MFERICLTWQAGRAMVTYTIDAKERLIRTQCTGHVTLAEVVAHFQQLAADPACPNFLDALLDVLLDLRTIDRPPHVGQLEAVTREVRKVQSKVRFGNLAIVVERDVVFGVFRMFEVMAQDYFTAIRVFRSAAEAELWLASQRVPAR
ncbi:MAG: hypothetical protein WBQ08_08700 [Candidatus Sulfotelmatobacter sp.]